MCEDVQHLSPVRGNTTALFPVLLSLSISKVIPKDFLKHKLYMSEFTIIYIDSSSFSLR